MLAIIQKIMIAYGHVLFRYRNIIFPLVLLSLILLFNPEPFGGTAQTDIWLDLTGILVILTGQALRAAVIGLAYIKRGGVNKQIYADQLVTSGMFAHCRNPLYTGNLLILCGLLVVHNNLMVYVLGGGFFLFSYVCIVTAEEIYLGQKFGELYTNYCHKVNRWLPDLRGLESTLNTMHFDWRRVLYKDYTTMLTWLLTLLFMLAYEQITLYGFDRSIFILVIHSGLALIAASIALRVRLIKKNGRLARKPLF